MLIHSVIIIHEGAQLLLLHMGGVYKGLGGAKSPRDDFIRG